jgi:hypothetical protein
MLIISILLKVIINALLMSYLLMVAVCFAYTFTFKVKINLIKRVRTSFYWAWLVFFNYKKYISETHNFYTIYKQ